ncbi:MAG: EamA family transporter [Alphaproteobacteria bacterium]|nr:EamA family transporter [Alphaproteobacteria bacterium]
MVTPPHDLTVLPVAPLGPPERPTGAKSPATLSRVFGAVPPPLLVLFSIISVQIGAAIAIDLFPVLGAAGTAFLRVAVSAVFLVIVARPVLEPKVRAQWKLILLFGFVVAAMNFFFYQAIARIPLGIAVTIEFMGPLAVAAATSRQWRDFLWVGLALGGVGLLTPAIGSELDPVGVVFAILAGCGWGAFALVSTRAGRALDGSIGLALGMAVAALFLLPFGIVEASAITGRPELVLPVIAIALLSTAVPFTLEFEALKRMTPRTYGILVTLEPAAAGTVGVILLGEVLDAPALLAMACVIVAAIGVTLQDRRGPRG